MNTTQNHRTIEYWNRHDYFSRSKPNSTLSLVAWKIFPEATCKHELFKSFLFEKILRYSLMHIHNEGQIKDIFNELYQTTYMSLYFSKKDARKATYMLVLQKKLTIHKNWVLYLTK